ncbi:hypothetical protein [Niallia nealsonii]|uniref:hypothetical protein n=1 Tax=Niallia nealsonii TaxID=115979 RepID=UPI0014472159|nr:hypothetical protein [Niallia nealsonii]
MSIPEIMTSKPSLVVYNSKLYLLHNTNNSLTTSWGTLGRSATAIREVNLTDLSFSNVVELQSSTGLHYTCPVEYKGDLYMSFSEDRRKLNKDQLRSNIGFFPIVFSQ